MSKNCLTFPPAAVSFNGFARTRVRVCVKMTPNPPDLCEEKKKLGG